MKTSFSFLSKHWDDLSQLGEMAEKNLHIDPSTTLVKMRMFGEKVASIGLEMENIKEDTTLSQNMRIKQLLKLELISYEIYDMLHFLRIRGNRAVHEGNYGTIEEAKTALEYAMKLGIWLVEVYGPWDLKVSELNESTKRPRTIKKEPFTQKMEEYKHLPSESLVSLKIERFHNNESEYVIWLDNNIFGYVFNQFGGSTTSKSSKEMNKFHRAECIYLRRKQDDGKRTIIAKICSTSKKNLIEYVTNERGDSWKCCKRCF